MPATQDTTDETPLLPPKPLFKNTTDAFEKLLVHHFNDFTEASTHQTCGSHLKNWAIRIGAAGVGGLAAYYYIPGAQEAAEFLCKKFNISETILGDIITAMFPFSSGVLNTLLGAQCLIETAENLRRPNKLHQHLKNDPTETSSSNWWRYGKTAFFTAVSLIVPFALTYGAAGAALALGTTAAAAPVNYIGVNNLFKKEIPKYQTILPEYINKILENLRNWFQKDPEKVINIMDNIEINMSALGKGATDHDKADALLQEILKIPEQLLATNVEIENSTQDNIHLVKESDISLPRDIFTTVAKTLAITSCGGYAWTATTAVTDKIPSIPLKIVPGIITFLTALVPLVGLSSRSGEQVGNNLFSGKKELSDTLAPNITLGLKAVIGVLSLFSGGTNMSVNHKFVTQFPLMGKIFTDMGQEVVSDTYMTDAIFGAAMTNGYYSAKLIDEIVVFFMQHLSSDENVQRYIKFDTFLQKLSNNFSEMSTPNFDQVLQSKFLWETGNDAHNKNREHLVALFQQRLLGSEYTDLLKKLDLDNIHFQKPRHIERHDPSELIPPKPDDRQGDTQQRAGFKV